MTCFVIIKFCICTASGSSFLCFSHPMSVCVSLCVCVSVCLTLRESVSFCLCTCVCVSVQCFCHNICHCSMSCSCLLALKGLPGSSCCCAVATANHAEVVVLRLLRTAGLMKLQANVICSANQLICKNLPYLDPSEKKQDVCAPACAWVCVCVRDVVMNIRRLLALIVLKFALVQAHSTQATLSLSFPSRFTFTCRQFPGA